MGSVSAGIAIAEPLPARREGNSWQALIAATEVAAVFAGILLYIWRWQHTMPYIWVALLAVIMASHALRRETPRDLGLTGTGLRPSAQMILPLALVLYIPLLFYGATEHRLGLLRPGWNSLFLFLGYGVWCVAQQYLAQSYFHNRLMIAIPNRHLQKGACARAGCTRRRAVGRRIFPDVAGRRRTTTL